MGDTSVTLEYGTMDGPGDKPFWAKCVKCAHCWPVAYLPMDVRTVARAAKNATCPRCGNRKPVVAKQSNGVLQEPEARQALASRDEPRT